MKNPQQTVLINIAQAASVARRIGATAKDLDSAIRMVENIGLSPALRIALIQDIQEQAPSIDIKMIEKSEEADQVLLILWARLPKKPASLEG